MKKHIRMTMLILLSVCVSLSSLFLWGCSNKNENANKKHKIKVAEQYGLAYAPLEIMKQQKIFEKNLPGVEIEWKQLGNTAAIREAMLSDDVNVGFMAIPPFLIGWDKGMKWKIAFGLSESPVGLVTYKENIKSIRDFSKSDRIAMPQPGSVQHILLAMACEKELGDSHKLDEQLVTLSHPDGMNALLAKKDITAHFTSPPYLSKELETPGMHRIITGRDAMGSDFTFIIGVTTEDFYRKNPEAYKAFAKSVNESIDFINNNPEKSASMLSSVYSMSEQEIIKHLKSEGVVYSTNVKGISKFAAFMKNNGYITKPVNNMGEIVWDDVSYE